MGAGRDQNLAAQMAAFLFCRDLIFEVYAGNARFDEGTHDFITIQRATKTGFGIGHYRRIPVARRSAFAHFNLIGPAQGCIDFLGQFRRGIGRVKRLIRIHRARRVGVRSDLPTRQIDRFEARADHLHRLIARQCTKRVNVRFGFQQIPQLGGTMLGQCLLDMQRTAQSGDLIGGVVALDIVKAVGCRAGDEGCKSVTRHKMPPVRTRKLALP